MPTQFRALCFAITGIWTGLLLGILPATGCADDTLVFERDVLPILSNKCFTCHGPDEAQREAGLRLDQRTGLFEPADSGDTPVVPRKPDQSSLLTRIHSADESFRMPPPAAEKQLTAEERTTLQRWVESGAAWQLHWAFEVPRQAPVPEYPDDHWSRTEIDRFVFQALRDNGLKPAPPASRETLLRRLYLDLIGLPPTPEQRIEFLNDTSPDAVARVVDQLLASPHYGEQMAVGWLDAARYADSNGYQNDFGRAMGPWRDWVIRAFNENQPFDQFVIEQIAGDLLPNATLDQKIATGFNRNNRTVTEGGSINEEWLVENVVDRVETTSATLLGLTLGCARCHDHKFDPITQREFYQFFAFFNNVAEQGVYNEARGNVAPLIQVPTEDQQAQLASSDLQIGELSDQIVELESRLDEGRAAWEQGLKEAITGIGNQQSSEPRSGFTLLPIAGGGTPLNPGPAEALTLADDRIVKSILGDAIVFDTTREHTLPVATEFQFHHDQPFTVSAWVNMAGQGAVLSRMDKAEQYRGFDLLLLPDGKLNVHLIHRWTEDAIKVTTVSAIKPGQWSHVAVTWDGSQKASGLTVYLDAVPVPLDVNNDTLTGTTVTQHPMWLGKRGDTVSFDGQLADIRVRDRAVSRQQVREWFQMGGRQLAETLPSAWTDQQRELANRLYRNGSGTGLAELHTKKTELEQAAKRLRDSIPTTMIMAEQEPRRATYVLRRGVYDQPQKDVEILPGVPAVLPPLKAAHVAHLESTKSTVPDRLALALWLMDRDNPLTSRVTVSRIWQQHFGIGLHGTPEDFGIQSPPPVHQALLDWLAVDLMEHGWDLKRLHRQIVLSQTYQQSAAVDEASYANDPNNVQLARGPRFRLPAETIRDNALVVSGLLNSKMGGPPIKPYQPVGLWQELAGGASQGPYRQDQGIELYRRSVYINRKRTVPPPSMSIFDAGSREVCQVGRQRTNTPMQALALLNDATYIEAARQVAVLAIESADLESERIEHLFVRVTSRSPRPEEMAVLADALARYKTHFTADPDAAKALIATGDSPVPAHLDPVNLAAYQTLAGVLLNLDETISRE